MEIGTLHSNQAAEVAAAREQRKSKKETKQEKHVDSVEISGNARAEIGKLADSLLREVGPDVVTEATKTLSQKRLDQIRQRIATGYYNQPGVLGSISDLLTDEML
jgi:phage terminase Nu1 subunit (DNA packaging protein)